MGSYYVIEEWTKENMGEFNASSVYMTVPRSQFAKRIGFEDERVEYFGIFDESIIKNTQQVETSISLFSRMRASVVLKPKENLFVEEKLGKTSVRNSYDDGFSLSDSFIVNPNIKFHQYLSFFDTKVKANNGQQSEESNAEREPITILSDLEFSFAPEGQREFATYCNRKSPVGYSALRPLYAGDYEYKDAIVGVQVTLSPPVDGRYGIVGSKLNVDVEDVVDKGEDEVVGLTMIGFNKSYYTKPKIFTHISNANQPCVAVIEEISIDALPNYPRGYFKVRFKSLEDGTDVNGWLSWLAEGY